MFWLKPKDNKLEPQMQFVEPQELWYNLFSYFLPFRNNFYSRYFQRKFQNQDIFHFARTFFEGTFDYTLVLLTSYFSNRTPFLKFFVYIATFFIENVNFSEKNQYFKNRTEKLKFEI